MRFQAAANRLRRLAEAMSIPESNIDNFTWLISNDVPALLKRREFERPRFKSLVPDRQSVPIPSKNLDAVSRDD